MRLCMWVRESVGQLSKAAWMLIYSFDITNFCQKAYKFWRDNNLIMNDNEKEDACFNLTCRPTFSWNAAAAALLTFTSRSKRDTITRALHGPGFILQYITKKIMLLHILKTVTQAQHLHKWQLILQQMRRLYHITLFYIWFLSLLKEELFYQQGKQPLLFRTGKLWFVHDLNTIFPTLSYWLKYCNILENEHTHFAILFT